MNRRSFLGSFFKAAAIACVAPSLLAEVEKVKETWKTYQVDEYTIKYMSNYLFDGSAISHPNSSTPLETYKIVFIDEENKK